MSNGYNYVENFLPPETVKKIVCVLLDFVELSTAKYSAPFLTNFYSSSFPVLVRKFPNQ